MALNIKVTQQEMLKRLLTPTLTLTRYFGVLTLQREAPPDDDAADQRRPHWCALGS